ncbi:MAG: exo-alpha-sialidase, partial [Fibrobacteres bacterium]|nr:exo-alpha-sialidase [Fibrobacterota bacterium]
MNRIYTALVLYIAVNISGWDLYRVTDDGFYSADPSISVLGDTVAIAYESYAYGNDEIVMKYSLNRGASFSSPIRISTNDSCSWRPKISISNGFDIVWEDNRTGKRQIFYSRILNGTPSVNLRISSGIGASAFPSMASDGQNLFIMWEDNRDGNDEIYFRKFDGGTWSPEKRVTSTDSTSWGATVAYDKSTGLLHAAYFDYSTGNDEIYYISSTDRGATWSTPVNISNDTPDSWEPRIAALNGRVAIVWYSYNTSSQSYEVLFSEKSGTTFSLPVFVSSTGNDSKCPTITMNSSSTSVAWEDFRDGNDEIYTATRTNGQLVWIEERVTNDPADSFGAAAFATSDNL